VTKRLKLSWEADECQPLVSGFGKMMAVIMGFNQQACNTNPISEGLNVKMLGQLQAQNGIDGYAW